VAVDLSARPSADAKKSAAQAKNAAAPANAATPAKAAPQATVTLKQIAAGLAERHELSQPAMEMKESM